jgi:alpha,alpha-trehalose-phosphate synthase [UDP-forming]
MNEIKRMVCVSNRLPISLQQNADERPGGEAHWAIKPSSGGLVSALEPVLKNRGGMWIGWPGAAVEAGELDASLAGASRDAGYELQPVLLSQEEIDGFYYGFANEIIWPLFHGLPTRANFDHTYWERYESANRKFAEQVAARARRDDFIWIQDYHLMCVAHYLKQLGLNHRTAFFLHIPFPPPEIFLRLPWRTEVLEGLLAHDLVGFHTMRDRNNFLQCVREVVTHKRATGSGQVVTVKYGGREIRVGAFPISVDYDGLQRLATDEDVALQSAQWKQQFGNHGMQVMIGMDRLDYTKGIPERLAAFKLALERYPELRGKLTLVQVTVPSREEVPEYAALLGEIERLVGHINGEFTDPGVWVPIHYLHRSLTRAETIAYLRACEIALVTPLRDGMNLVAKEYCACDVEEDGVLILSEFAGAAAELSRGALMVNPHDVSGIADAIHAAYNMRMPERRRRMRRLREQVREHNIYEWVGSILEAAYVPSLDNFPVLGSYVPDLKLEHGA